MDPLTSTKPDLLFKVFAKRKELIILTHILTVTRMSSIRMLIAIAAMRNLEVHQMDVKTAFLNGDLNEEIYIKQPEGFVVPGLEHKVCKLVKSIYGLKQAPRRLASKI